METWTGDSGTSKQTSWQTAWGLESRTAQGTPKETKRQTSERTAKETETQRHNDSSAQHKSPDFRTFAPGAAVMTVCGLTGYSKADVL